MSFFITAWLVVVAAIFLIANWSTTGAESKMQSDQKLDWGAMPLCENFGDPENCEQEDCCQK